MTFEELLAIDKMSKAEVIGITAIATGLVNIYFFGTWAYVVQVELYLLLLYLHHCKYIWIVCR